MNKNIKQLIESLFDDEYDDIISNQVDKNSLTSDKINSIDNIKPILKKIDDECLSNILLQCDTLSDLSIESKKKNGLFIPFILMSVHRNNIDLYKQLFDILLECDIHLNIQVIQFQLENENNTLYKISDLFDFEKYRDILRIRSFSVTHGKLQSFEGFPSYIQNEISLNWIKYIGSLKGFPNTKNYLTFYIYNSKLPEDWTGCPHILQQLNFQPNLPSDVNKDVESIISDIGTLKNIPYDLKFEKNNIDPSSDNYIGCMLVEPDWYTDTKKEIRKYIGNCLKSQYKNIMQLKKTLCYSLKLIL